MFSSLQISTTEIAIHEVVEVAALESVFLQREMEVGAQIVDPEFGRPQLFLRGFAVEEISLTPSCQGLFVFYVEQNTYAVLLSWVTYSLYVLLPLIPPILLLRRFSGEREMSERAHMRDTKDLPIENEKLPPERDAMLSGDNVWVTGTIRALTSVWKVRAGGAFAAYIIAVLLGYFLINRTLDIIEGMSTSVWTLHGPVTLKDAHGKEISDTKILGTMDIEMSPRPDTHTGAVVDIRIPSQGTELPESTTIVLTIPSFGSKTIDLGDWKKNKFKVDNYHHRIDFRDNPVVIEQALNTLQSAPIGAVAYQKPSTGPGPGPVPTPKGP